MIKYVIRRLLLLIPIALGVTILVFLLMHLTGDPVKLMLGYRATPEQVEELRRELGLDKPIYLQYFLWVSNVIRGNLGTSIVTREPVSKMIIERIPATLELTIPSLIISTALAISVAVIYGHH